MYVNQQDTVGVLLLGLFFLFNVVIQSFLKLDSWIGIHCCCSSPLLPMTSSWMCSSSRGTHISLWVPYRPRLGSIWIEVKSGSDLNVKFINGKNFERYMASPFQFVDKLLNIDALFFNYWIRIYSLNWNSWIGWLEPTLSHILLVSF